MPQEEAIYNDSQSNYSDRFVRDKRMKKKIKVSKIRLSAIDKMILSVYIREQKRVEARKVKRYQLEYMR